MPLASSLPTRMPESVGNTYYVAYTGARYTGNDSRTAAQAQTISTPWATIAKALTVAGTGDTVVVVDGSVLTATEEYGYAFHVNGKTASQNNPLTIRAETQWGVTITTPTSYYGQSHPHTYAVFVTASTGIRLRGLKFSKILGFQPGQGGSHALWVYGSSHVDITGCLFEDIGSMCVVVASNAVGYWCQNVQVFGNLFRPSGTTSVTRVAAAGTGFAGRVDVVCGCDADPNQVEKYESKGNHILYAGIPPGADYNADGGSRGLVFANNIVAGTCIGSMLSMGQHAQDYYVVNNTFYGSRPGFYQCSGNSAHESGYEIHGVLVYGDGPDAYRSRNGQIRNNLFQSFDGHPVAGGWIGPPSGYPNYVYNNIAYDAENSYDTARTTDWHADSADYFEETTPGGQAQPCFLESGNTVADPLFVAPASSPAGNFALQAGSPALGTATADYSPTTDFYGNARHPNAPSMGAIEGDSGAPAPAATTDALNVGVALLTDGSTTTGFTTAFQTNGLSAAVGAGSVPVVESVATGDADNSDPQQLTITKPTGTASGDVLVAMVAFDYDDTNSWSTPSGWTLQGTAKTVHGSSGNNRCVMSCFTRRADGTEGASFTFSMATGGGSKAGWIARVSGVDAGVTDLSHQFATFNDTTDSTAHTSPSVTTTSDNCLILSGFASGADNPQSCVAAGSETEVADVDNSNSSWIGYSPWIGGYRTDKATAGAVDHDVTFNATATCVSITLAIEPGGSSEPGLHAASAPGGGYWAGLSTAASAVMVHTTVKPASTNTMSAHWRAQNAARDNVPAASASDWSGYSLELTEGTTDIVVSRWNGTTRTVVATFTQSWAAGAWFAATHIGTGGAVYYKTATGNWQRIGTFTDATYADGYIGLEFEDVTGRITDFGGGTPVIRLGAAGAG